MTKLKIEASFSEDADRQAIVERVLALQAAGTLSDVWGEAPLGNRSCVARLLVITPDGDDSALKSAFWDVASLPGLEAIQVSALLDNSLFLRSAVRQNDDGERHLNMGNLLRNVSEGDRGGAGRG